MPYEWLDVAFGVISRWGIEPYEVLQVLFGKVRRPVPVRSRHGLALLNVWGTTAHGRRLIVTVRPGKGFDSVIVGAREMSTEETKEFEAWVSSR